MNNPVIMHANYCEQGQTLAEMCRKAVNWGFDGVEFRRARGGVEETEDEYLGELELAVSASGLKHVLFGHPTMNLAPADQSRREVELEDALRFFRKAARLFELTVCNATAGAILNQDKNIPYDDYKQQGSFIATADQWRWAAEGFRELGRLAGELKFKFAFETHPCYLHDMPVAAKKLVDLIASPAVGVNLDYGNVIYFDNPPALNDTIDLLGKSLFYVHLKNSARIGPHKGLRLPTALAEGEINHREFLRLLQRAGYAGPICIEAPRPGDREWFARSDLAYVRQLMNA